MQTSMHRSATAVVVPRCPVAVADLHCPRTAGFGTDHPGTGRCRQHDLEAAAAARAVARKQIPPAHFQEPVYVDGLPYQETAPTAAIGVVTCDDEADEWENHAVRREVTPLVA
ncbi:hypothetical protein ABZ619_39215 [Streptomyces sp. NPDC007851]|uniref:hypothetical protein n=1 Tax=Streptomyces sp. NPDC007851 TaxID=3155008 RepID=UPI0033FB1857